MIDDPAEPFYAAIRAAPEDDLPRLVLADWLDENGQPERAEYIRLTCAIARTPDREQKPGWQTRATALFMEFRKLWFGSLPDLFRNMTNSVEYDRGFISKIHATAAVLETHASQLRQFAPVLRKASVASVGETAGAVLSQESIRRLKVLSLFNVTPASLDYLTAHTHLPELQHLHLGISGCANAAEGSRFLHWELAQNSPNLSLAPCFQQEDQSTVSGTDEQSALFVNNIRLANLTGLTLRRVDHLTGTALAEWSGIRHLDTLGFHQAQPRVVAFLQASWLSSLHHLVFWNSPLDQQAIVALGNCPYLVSLKTLGLSETRLTDEGVYTLIASQYLPSDLRLIVSGNPFSSHAAARLRERFPNVRF